MNRRFFSAALAWLRCRSPALANTAAPRPSLRRVTVKRPFPLAERAARSALAWYDQYPPERESADPYGPADGPRLTNPIRLLAAFQPQLSAPPSSNEIAKLIAWHRVAIPRFRQTDGAFSRFTHQFLCQPLDRTVRPASRPMSDVNGTGTHHLVRPMLWQLLGHPTPRMPGREQFWERLLALLPG